jgi:hypothetical protein
MPAVAVMRRPRRWAGLVALVLLLALVPRALLVEGTRVMAPDGVGYIEASRGGEDGAAKARLPLYPALIALARPWAGDAQTAGQLVSLIAGSLFPLAVLLLGLVTLPRAAPLAALIACVLPLHVRLSADVLTEALYLLLLAVTFLALARRPVTLARGIVAGASAGLLSLTRPEGLLVAGLACLLVLRRARKEGKERRPAVAFLLCLLALLSVHLFRLDHLGETLGSFTTTLEGARGLSRSAAPGAASRLLAGVIRAPWEFASALDPVPFALGGIGLLVLPKRRRRFVKRLGFPVVASMALFVFFAAVRPGERYLLQATIPWILLGGVGARALVQRWPRAGGLAVALGLVACLVHAGTEQRADKLWMRELGEAIAVWSAPERPVLVTTSSRIAYYAGARRVDPASATIVPDDALVLELTLPGEDAPLRAGEDLLPQLSLDAASRATLRGATLIRKVDAGKVGALPAWQQERCQAPTLRTLPVWQQERCQMR